VIAPELLARLRAMPADTVEILVVGMCEDENGDMTCAEGIDCPATSWDVAVRYDLPEDGAFDMEEIALDTTEEQAHAIAAHAAELLFGDRDQYDTL
jgi:hypothetical protein